MEGRFKEMEGFRMDGRSVSGSKEGFQRRKGGLGFRIEGRFQN